MLLRVDAASDQPLYAQIASGIRSGVANGDLSPGERLPSARELASVLGVNMHTVLRAYTLLQQEGVLTLRRGRGAVVGEPPSRLHELVRALVAEAERRGIPRADVAAMLQDAD